MWLTMLTVSCESEQHVPVRDTAGEFFQVYGARSDEERFLGFYADDAMLLDILNGDSISGKQALAVFFDWSNPEFKSLGSQALEVDELIADGNIVVAKGHFTRFQWGDTVFEAMHFTTLLTFDKQGKIIKQVDWINYPSTLVDYGKRKNSNRWIE